jgi:hypothetical protein
MFVTASESVRDGFGKHGHLPKRPQRNTLPEPKQGQSKGGLDVDLRWTCGGLDVDLNKRQIN